MQWDVALLSGRVSMGNPVESGLGAAMAMDSLLLFGAGGRGGWHPPFGPKLKGKLEESPICLDTSKT